MPVVRKKQTVADTSAGKSALVGKKAEPTRRCHRCRGSGRMPCQICNGAGEIRVGTDRTGKVLVENCAGCYGSKTSRCSICGGLGLVQ